MKTKKKLKEFVKNIFIQNQNEGLSVTSVQAIHELTAEERKFCYKYFNSSTTKKTGVRLQRTF